MIRLAVVGDMGSGKSYVAKQFGHPVFNADVEVNKLYKTNKKCFIKLKKLLPKYIISFPIKKNELFKAIIKNQSNLKKITKVIHPEVRIKMNKFLMKNRNKKIVVLDIPLLLENKINKKNDVLIFVDAKKSQIYKKLKRRQNFNLKLFKKLKKIQLPVEYKKKKSQFILKNNFTNKFLKKGVKRILKEILQNVRSNT
jgi:dephospho-CoA kinase